MGIISMVKDMARTFFCTDKEGVAGYSVKWVGGGRNGRLVFTVCYLSVKKYF